jgi:glycosyltransferase involved in cell wall biosynthesis
MATISACLVVWNGEKEIRSCLENIKKVVDDIVIVHDGPCRDRTLEICRAYTKKVYVRPAVGEAEPHRAFGFSKASGDWILWIDQDERLSKPLRQNIRKLVQREDADAYSFLWAVKYGNKMLTKGYFSKMPKTVLFRKKAMLLFRGLPNEMIRVRGRVVHTNYRLLHYPEGERHTMRVFFKNTLRIVRIHADQMLKKNLVTKQAPWYLIKAFLWFFLYLCYYFGLHFTFLTKADISITIQNGLYNFYLYWYIFWGKLGLWKLKTAK